MNKTVLISCLILGWLATSCTRTPDQLTPTPQLPLIPAVVSASGKLVPALWANLSFRAGGRVSQVNAQAGDKIEAGQVLARLDDTDARLALAEANAALKAAQAQLAQVKAGARPEEIEQQKQAVRAAQAALTSALAQLGQLEHEPRPTELAQAEAALSQAEATWKAAVDEYDANLRNGGLGLLEEHLRAKRQATAQAVEAARIQLDQLKAGATQDELGQARAAVSAAQAERDAAQARLDQMMAGPTPEQIAVAQASVAQAQAAADLAQAALDKTQLKAPFAGTVGSLSVRLGELVTPGQPVLTLGDLSTLRVETTDLSEVDVARVSVGQPVNVTFDAVKGTPFSGKITRIAPMSSSGQGGVNYTVVVELDQLDPALRWGMTAFADIQTAK